MADDRTGREAELQRAYAEYRAAMTAWRAADKANATTDATDERLLQARVQLYRALVGTGWVAPAGVTIQLERDIALVEAPRDFEAVLANSL